MVVTVMIKQCIVFKQKRTTDDVISCLIPSALFRTILEGGSYPSEEVSLTFSIVPADRAVGYKSFIK